MFLKITLNAKSSTTHVALEIFHFFVPSSVMDFEIALPTKFFTANAAFEIFDFLMNNSDMSV